MSNRNNVISFSCADRGLIDRAKQRAKSEGLTFAKFVVKLLLEEQGLTWKDLKTPRMGAPVRYPAEKPEPNEKSAKKINSTDAILDTYVPTKKKRVLPRRPPLKKSATENNPAPSGHAKP